MSVRLVERYGPLVTDDRYAIVPKDGVGAARQAGPATMRSLAFDRLAASATVLDGLGVIVDTNAAWRLFAQLNGASPTTTGLGVDYLAACDRAAAEGCDAAGLVASGLRDLLTGDRAQFDLEYPCPSPGEDRWYLLQASAAPISGGTGAIVLHSDITASKVRARALVELAGQDELTGLPKRGAAHRFLEEHLAADVPVAVMFLDLDGFKEINDRFGHHVGDELLVKVALRLQRQVQDGALVARFGGDEFVVVGSGKEWDLAGAHVFGEAIRAALVRPFQIGAEMMTVGVSLGVAASDEHSTADLLVQSADEQMYLDKQRTAGQPRGLADLIHPRGPRAIDGDLVDPAGPHEALVAELRASQALTKAVLAHSSDLVIFFSADGTIDWVSPPVRKLFGVDADALIGTNGFEMIHPDDRERVLGEFLTIPGLGDSVVSEFRLVMGDEVRWVEEIATNLLDEPDVGRIVGNLRDVTERKAAQDAVVFQGLLLAAAGQAIVARDTDGHVLYWNDAAEALYGWSAAEAVGHDLRRLLPLAEGSNQPPAVANVAIGGEPWEGELTVITRSGRPVPIMVTSRPVFDASGELVATTVVSSDITRRVQRRHQDDDARRRLADAQASARLGSFEVDLATGKVTRSAEFWRILGLAPGSQEGVTFDRIHPDDREMVKANFAAAAAGQHDVSCTHRIVQPDGHIRWVLSRCSPTLITERAVVAGTILDITERHEAELALAHQANHDPLTGLANRRLLVEALELSIERGAASGRHTGVVFVDLDDFKVINDRFGHVDGDSILRAVGELFDGVTSQGDTVARLGGDEYVVCCDDVSDAADLLERVARLHACLHNPFRIRQQSHTLSASMGVAISTPGVSAEALLRNADAAMYVAKQAGGARSELFDDAIYAHVRRRQELAAEIVNSLDAGHFHTHFQPEVDLRTGTLVGFEALARWDHPERGFVSPAEFIEIAETTGTIGRLGRHVLIDGCRALASWSDTSPEQHLTVAINVSPVQLADPDFPTDVGTIIRAAGVPPERVCLEVTESSLMELDVAAETLRSLKAIGVTIAIDDFGTGYSSLSRLKRFPVDLLKIDRSFVGGLGTDPEDEVIVATVINLARSLGIAVIAEGVETQDQLDLLATYGCELGQGFLWSPALTPTDAAAYAAQPHPLRRATTVPAVGICG